MIFMIIAGYFQDDVSDELTNDSMLKAELDNNSLSYRHNISRCHNRMDEDYLNQFFK